MRKNILFVIVLAISLVIISLGFYFVNNQEEYNTDPIDAVPISSECILSFSSLNNFHKLMEDNKGIIKDINKFESLANIKSLLADIFSGIDSNSSFFDINTDNRFVCATKLTGKSNVDLLFVFPVKNNNEATVASSFLKNYFKDYSSVSRNYSGNDITRYSKGKNGYSVAFVKGLMLLSESPIFIEDAIRQIGTSPKLKEIPDFSIVYKTAGENADINIFLNNRNMPKLLKLLSSKENRSFASSLSNVASWTSLDIDVDKEYLQLNGFSKTDEKRFDMMDIFVNQEPVESQLIDVVPSNIPAFALMSLSDAGKFREDNKRHLNQVGKLREYRRGMSQLKKLYGKSFEDIFYSFFDDEAACISMSVNSLNINKDKLAVFRTKGSGMVKESMIGLLDHYAKNHMKPLSHYVSKIVIDRETSYEIFRLSVNDIPYRLMGRMFNNVPSDYFMIVDNFLVFGGSKKALTDFAHSYVLKKNIQTDPIYKECSRLFTSKGNFKFYSNTGSSLPLLNSYLNDDVKKVVNKNKENISKFYATCYQFSSVNDMIYNNLFFMYSEKQMERPHTIWESGLDAGVNMKPVIVKNHKTNAKEIVIQDEQNNMYLVNSTGRVLWKLPLEGKIQGEVYQVDKYRNNKLQYMFSTGSKIYLIDRNGNHVGRFPVLLKSNTAKGISVFDYDSSRKYRIFVPCQDKKVYLYDMEGNIVKGWKFGKTENNIVSRVNHYRIGNKDYIVLADEYKVYILDRRGKVRSSTDKYFNISPNANFVVANKSNPRTAHLLITDTKGSIYKISFNGKINKLNSLGEFTANHRFTAEDLNGDKYLEYIYCDGNKLRVYSRGKKLFEFKTKGKIEGMPNIFTFGWNNKKIGILDGDNKLIYLINNKGEVYKGFPVQGRSPFSISFMKGKNRGFNMFVGSPGSSLYNYKVKL